MSATKPKRDARQTAGRTALVLLGALVALALLAIAMTGITSASDVSFSGLSRIATFTVVQAFLSALLAIGLAIPVALALDSLPTPRIKRFMLTLFTLPLCLPVIVAVMALLTLAGRNGLFSQASAALGLSWRANIYGLSGILLAHVFFNMPLAVRLMVQGFEAIPGEQWKLAESLGFRAKDRFLVLQWPVLRTLLPGLVALIFLLCMGSYAIILILGGGPQTTTLQVGIYQALSFDFDIARAGVLTLIQLLLTLLLLALLPRAQHFNFTSGFGTTRRYHETNRVALCLHALIVFAAASLVALPLLAIINSGVSANHSKLFADPLLWQAAFTSTLIGLASMLLALALAWALAASSYGKHSRLASVPLMLLGLPPLVLGVGWFLVAVRTGIPLTVAPVLLVLANAMMALPFAMQIITPALHQSFQNHDRLSASLGIQGWSRLRLIDLPSLRSALVTAGLFSFALSLGDLGVVTLFGADQILTLPSLIFQKMGSYRSEDAAGLALYLALVTGLISYLAIRMQRHEG
jgi:thiamine transport system permease protein